MFLKCSAQHTFSAFLGARMSCHPVQLIKIAEDSKPNRRMGRCQWQWSIEDCTSILRAGSHYHYLHSKTPGFFFPCRSSGSGQGSGQWWLVVLKHTWLFTYLTLLKRHSVLFLLISVFLKIDRNWTMSELWCGTEQCKHVADFRTPAHLFSVFPLYRPVYL